MSEKPDITKLEEGITLATDGKLTMHAGEEEHKTVLGVTYEYSHGDVHEMFKGHKLELNMAALEEFNLVNSLKIGLEASESVEALEVGAVGAAFDVSGVGASVHGVQRYVYGVLSEFVAKKLEAHAERDELTALKNKIAASEQRLLGACDEVLASSLYLTMQKTTALANDIKTVAQATHALGSQVATIASSVDLSVDRTALATNQTRMNAVDTSIATLTTLI